MGVRVSQFGRLMDKKKKPLAATVKRAAKISSVTRKPDKFQRPTTLDRIILSLLKFKRRDLTKGIK